MLNQNKNRTLLEIYKKKLKTTKTSSSIKRICVKKIINNKIKQK